LENDAAQSGQPVDPQDALARLQQLEEEAKRLRERLTAANPSATREAAATGVGEDAARATPANPVAQEAASKEESPEAQLPRPTDAQKDEADKLIQRYRLEKQRGNKDFAKRYLSEAAELAPGYTYVLECQGDEAADSRRIEEAKKYYKLAKEADIRNSSAETKFANLVFRAQAAPAAAHLKVQEASTNTRNAGCLSAIVPGAGQFVLGQQGKGAVFFILYVACLFAVPTGIRSTTNLLSQNGKPVETWAILGLAGAFFIYIANIVDITSYAKSAAAREKFMGIETKKERPKPPVDKPFE